MTAEAAAPPHELADVVAINRLLDDYAAAIDDRDWDALRRVFTPDAVLDYTSSGGPRAPFPEVAAWLERSLGLVAFTQHYVTNRRIDVDGDTARSRAYFWHPLRAGDAVFTAGGVYADRLQRTGDGWRIVERVQTLLWSDPPLPVG